MYIDLAKDRDIPINNLDAYVLGIRNVTDDMQ